MKWFDITDSAKAQMERLLEKNPDKYAVSLAVQEALQRDARALAGGDVVVRTSYQPATAEHIAFLTATSQTLSHGLEMRVMAGGNDATQRRLAEFKAIDNAYPVAGAGVGNGVGSAVGRPAPLAVDESLLPQQRCIFKRQCHD